ncbi:MULTISPECIES: hypothetical protein [Idiomarinaceae]|uniref:Uncharacterized protein n=2 Tax=Pseudidiomarina TaxID=2800384 RepID=A0AB39X3M0_9GAMM|nr:MULTISPECIES: hypothetical protein [Idiomarinaceae]MDX1525324.1 hypothetical protein [Pseudidiomarina maritima]MDT7524691.1 hypothetical protein [Pseudidiomarina sp. GXY010]MRJ41382.1 hypothetical protein [Idiomarina sp. FeN1]NCU56857.1 hypothetical protein [Idiomarina sp. FenA--70]NCU59566.1 hypothetical protein [Idiomarina sp. FenBw--71]
MIYAILILVIGFAAMLSGVWEHNLVTIIIGLVMQAGGAIGFFISWRKAAKQGHINNNDN